MATYTIQQGNHYADGINFCPVFCKRRGEYLVTFHQSCIYDLGNSNQGDVNKLCGWGHLDHRANGVRFGWRCVKKMIELVGYLHVGPALFGKQPHQTHVFEPQLLIYPEKEYKLVIDMHDAGNLTEYFFDVIDPMTSLHLGRKVAQRPKLSQLQKMIGTKNYFYFGGNEVAQHTMQANLTEL
jgi:hypothetical protein